MGWLLHVGGEQIWQPWLTHNQHLRMSAFRFVLNGRQTDMDDQEMNDPVEGAVAAYLDYLEGQGPRPTFDLSDDDRRRAVGVINLLLAGRGADLDSDAPPFEELLCGTEFECWVVTRRHPGMG